MIIILRLHVVVLWTVFSKFKPVRWGWVVGTVSLLIGGFILALSAIPKGISQGQVAVSGTLARTNALGGATVFPAVISIPDGMNRDQLRLGMSGSATAVAGNAGVIGLLASISGVGGVSYTAYL